jgi:hypothetical protein
MRVRPRVPRGAIGGVVLALAGCGANVEESLTTSVAADDSGSTSDASAASVSATEASLSESDEGASLTVGSDDTDATDDTASAESDSSTGHGDSGSDEGQVDSETSSADVGEEEDTSTGAPPVDCAPLDADACEAAGDDCMVVTGLPLVHENGPFWCLGDEEFAGCAAAAGCDDAPTIACEGRKTPWLFPSTCLPSGWAGCPTPGNGDLDACGA